MDVLEKCSKSGNFQEVASIVLKVFSRPENLIDSFCVKGSGWSVFDLLKMREIYNILYKKVI